MTRENWLWRAVLEQAYADAELPRFGSGFVPHARTRARSYLRADTPRDEEAPLLVCDFADIPCDRVILWARKQYPDAPPIVPRKRGPKPRKRRRLRTTAATAEQHQKSRKGNGVKT